VIRRFVRDPTVLLPPKRPLPWRQLVLLGLISMGLAVSLTLIDLHNTQAENGWLIHTGPSGPAAPLLRQDFPDDPQFDRGQHDGPMFYAIARSPFDLTTASQSLDFPRYRLQRPLFPWVARLVYLPGSGAGLVWAMFAVGAASVLIGSIALGSISTMLGGSPLVALAVGLLPGTLQSLRITTADTLSLALLLVALALSLRGYAKWAIVLAVLCVLAKETALTSLVGFALWRRDKWGALLAGVPLVVAGSWALYLRHAVPSGEGTLLDWDLPFQGLYDAFKLWLTGDNVLTLFCIVGGVVISAIGLYRAGFDHPLSFAVLANLAILVVFNVDVIGLDRNSTRITMPLLALAITLLATATSWRRPVPTSSADRATV
jgi:hypothetical protein